MNNQSPDQQPPEDRAPTPPRFIDEVLADIEHPPAPTIPPVVKPSLPKSSPPAPTEEFTVPDNDLPDPTEAEPTEEPLSPAAQEASETVPPPKEPLRPVQEPQSPASLPDQQPEQPPSAEESQDTPPPAPKEPAETALSALEPAEEMATPKENGTDAMPRRTEAAVSPSDPRGDEEARSPAPVVPPKPAPAPASEGEVPRTTSGNPALNPLPAAPRRDDPKSNRSTYWAFIGTAALIIFNIALIVFISFILFGREQPPSPVVPAEPQVIAPPRDEPVASPPPAPPPEREVRETVAPAEELLEDPTDPLPPTFTIPKLELIRGVRGFGQYDPLPDAPLRARHVPHMLAYVEMTNLVPEPRDDNRLTYYVSMRIKMYRADVGPSEPLMDTTVSNVFQGYSPRRDFFLTHALQSSRRIQPGEHIVAVRVVDQVSRAVAQSETSFVIASDE